jgi:Tfp pilus assembly protein PilF
VSLLLDALKRAEQEKHGRHAERAEPADNPRTPAPQLVQVTPSALELQPLPAVGAPRHDSPAAAQAVFNAKRAKPEPARNRGALWAGIGAAATLVIAAGGYVWYSVRSLTPAPVTAQLRARPPAAPTPAPGGSLGPGSPNTSGFVPQPPPASGSTFTPAADPGKPVAATLPLTPAPAAAAVPAPAATTAAPAPALALLKDATPLATPPALQLSRSVEKAQVPAAVASGYDALRGGDLVLARRNYAAAVAAEPANIDAQLGLATVEARLGNRGAAAGHYRKALEIDPRNATALAGMAALADGARPDALESQLRGDLAQHPASAALHFALGNLYASQSRWHEAQAAFFEAHRLDPGSADTVYNLAVSLDQLGQGRLAADYYRRALDAARGQATQFDAAPVARRLAELRP